MTTAVPSDVRISSRQHPVVQRFRRVAARAGAEADQHDVVLDGAHLLAEALAAGVPILAVLADDRHVALADRARRAGAETWLSTRAVVDAASPVRTPSGIVALAHWTPAPLERLFADPAPLVVGLVDVQDPGNVGSAIRSADALGATGVAALGETADPTGWKVLRGAMGSTFRVVVARGRLDAALDAARASGVRVLATTRTGGVDVAAADLMGPSLVLVGNEGAGLPAAVAEAADARISIPMRAGVDSLNVAVAAALILDEARRQRARGGRT